MADRPDQPLDPERFLAAHLQGPRDARAYGWWRRFGPDTVALNAGFPFPASFPTAELADSARAVLESEGALSLQYGGGPLVGKLKEQLTRFSAERDLTQGGAELLVTQGSGHALELIGRTFLGAGDSIVVEAPCFMGALAQFRNFRPEFLPIEQDGDGMIVEQLEEVLAARRKAGRRMPKLLYAIPNYHNPSGATMPLARRRSLLALAEEYDFLIVEDDAYGRLGFGDDPPPPALRSLDRSGRVLYVSTLSKLIAPGVRVGWVVAQAPLIAKLGQFNAVHAPFMHSVIAHYWEKGGMPSRIEWLRREYAGRCRTMLGLLAAQMPEGCEWTRPAGGFFTWLKLPEGVSSTEMFEAAGEAGVAYIPGQIFYPDGRGESFIRLAFSYAEPEAMARGIAALAGVVRARMGAVAR
jgi:2-aminoadipate transaminase